MVYGRFRHETSEFSQRDSKIQTGGEMKFWISKAFAWLAELYLQVAEGIAVLYLAAFC
jgi:hypothetical protein